jgi:uncharacterized protein (TIGR03083 family)
VEHETYLAQIVEQSEALRAAAVAAGPTANVPTCPEWTVLDLVRHIGRVHGWVCEVVRRGGELAAQPTPPEDWTELLEWWDEHRTAMLLELADPDRPAWMFHTLGGTSGFWARRQAHETAIHRLDAEEARMEQVPTLLFETGFAADGVDEVLTLLSPLRASTKRPEVTVEGRLLVHAADAGRAWMVHAHEGVVEAGPVEDAAVDVDATLAGTADAVYRAVWKRPSTAILNGRTELLHAVNGG